MKSMLKQWLERYKLWRKRRYWNGDRRLHHLRVTLMADNRWMAHDPVASALTERYLAMLSEDWYTRNFESVEALRARLGLDPHRKKLENNNGNRP